jgi:hypothetical protein
MESSGGDPPALCHSDVSITHFPRGWGEWGVRPCWEAVNDMGGMNSPGTD